MKNSITLIAKRAGCLILISVLIINLHSAQVIAVDFDSSPPITQKSNIDHSTDVIDKEKKLNHLKQSIQKKSYKVIR